MNRKKILMAVLPVLGALSIYILAYAIMRGQDRIQISNEGIGDRGYIVYVFELDEKGKAKISSDGHPVSNMHLYYMFWPMIMSELKLRLWHDVLVYDVFG